MCLISTETTHSGVHSTDMIAELVVQIVVVVVVCVVCILCAAPFAYQPRELVVPEKVVPEKVVSEKLVSEEEARANARATAREMAADLQRVQDKKKAAANAKPAAPNPPLLLKFHRLP